MPLPFRKGWFYYNGLCNNWCILYELLKDEFSDFKEACYKPKEKCLLRGSKNTAL